MYNDTMNIVGDIPKEVKLNTTHIAPGQKGVRKQSTKQTELVQRIRQSVDAVGIFHI